MYMLDRMKNDKNIKSELEKKFSFLNPSKKLILVTGHRRENFGTKIESICHAIKEISQRPDIEIIYPAHLNPNVQEPVKRILGGLKSVHLTTPEDYLPFIYLMQRSHFIITDSGGVQEEAPYLGKPLLVTRESTERPEVVKAGTALIVGHSPKTLVAAGERLLDDKEFYKTMSRVHQPYGDGNACQKILNSILKTVKAAA